MTISEHLGERLRLLRKQQHQTIVTVALATGIAIPSYKKYEAGQSNPTLSKLYALAEYFNVSLDYLTGRTHNQRVNY